MDSVVARIEETDVKSSLASLEDAVSKAAESFSGSWIGYHSRVYYERLAPPPAGAHFSPEWGLVRMSIQDTRGKWVESDEEYLRNLKVRAEKTKRFSVEDCVKRYQTHGSFFSRDMVAMTNGMQPPPHIYLLAQVDAIKDRKETASPLSKLSKQTLVQSIHAV